MCMCGGIQLTSGLLLCCRITVMEIENILQLIWVHLYNFGKEVMWIYTEVIHRVFSQEE